MDTELTDDPTADPADTQDAGAEPPPALDADEPIEAQNLVTLYQSKDEWKSWLDKTCANLLRRIKADDESRKEWMEQRADQIRLFAGVVQMLKYPAEGGRAPHDPILCRSIIQLWTRGWDQICPAKGDLIQVQPNGNEDEEIAYRRQEYMNWQLRHKVPNWVQGHAESYLQFLISGSVFREKYWDPVRRTTCFDHLTADDVIVAYSRKDIDPLMRDVPRITRVLRMYRWDLEKWEDEGAFVNVEAIYEKNAGADTSMSDSAQVMRDVTEEIDGVKQQTLVTSGDDKELAQRTLYRCHTWLKLPDQKKMKPVIVTIDKSTMIPLSLTIREDEDPLDMARFENESKVASLQMQNDATQYQQAFSMWQSAGGVGPEPPKPRAPEPPAPVRMKTLHTIVHYRCFPNPAGFYGIGVGYLLTNSNELVNQLETEYLLACRFANMQQGLLSKGALAKGKRGEIRLQMGKFIETDLEADQMAGIKSFQFPGPSEGLWKFIQKVKEDSYTLVANVDTLAGEAGPTNETKAAADARRADATALVGVITRLYTEPLKEEVKMLAHDNRVFMDDTEFYWVTTSDHQPPQGMPVRSRKQALRTDFLDEFDFTFTADSRLQTQPERINVAMSVINTLNTGPYAKDPQMGPVLYHLAYQRLFQAMDIPDFVKAMGPQPPPPQPPQPPPPPTPMDQVDETAGMYQGQDHPVLPDDNHVDHLTKIADFEESAFYKQMPATGKQLLDRHKAAHEANLYKQEAQKHMGGMDAIGMGPNGPGGGMGGGGNDQPLPGGPPPAPAGGAGPPSGGMPLQQ